jgi:toxin ParE1/3/4
MKPKPVGFAPLAERDLEDIADYIAADTPERALTFVQELRVRCRKVGALPLAARRFPQLGDDAHILPYENYIILYRNLPTEISIERILHGARDIMALIAPDD